MMGLREAGVGQVQQQTFVYAFFLRGRGRFVLCSKAGAPWSRDQV